MKEMGMKRDRMKKAEKRKLFYAPIPRDPIKFKTCTNGGGVERDKVKQRESEKEIGKRDRIKNGKRVCELYCAPIPRSHQIRGS